MHVPDDRRAGFDRAIDDVGLDGPLYRIEIEGNGIQITDPAGNVTRPFDGDGHLAWVGPTA